MGWAAIWICVVLYFFNFVSMLYVFMRELKHAYRMYSVKRKFILQYSRKGMIEQNYFKSSRDTGPKSKLKAKKVLSVGSSSRDDWSPGKKNNRRRRRRDLDSKSELVMKNDIDDVEEYDGSGGFQDDQSHDKQKHTREYMRNLRDAETAHKLQQIAEVDDDDSDDAFGPIENDRLGSPYAIVSNRSSHRAGTTSRDGPRPNTGAISVGAHIDDHYGSDQEKDTFKEEVDDKSVGDASKSSLTKSKKKKKKGKKKKKAQMLAAIGEDLLDSPVQSQGSDNDEEDSSKQIANDAQS